MDEPSRSESVGLDPEKWMSILFNWMSCRCYIVSAQELKSSYWMDTSMCNTFWVIFRYARPVLCRGHLFAF